MKAFNINEMYDLVDTLSDASRKYYNGLETISDKQFDDMYDRLLELEKLSGVILPNSPTNKVGYTVDNCKLPKVAHEYKSLSLDKTKDVTELREWLSDNNGVLSWKCDGLTIILTYDNGRLVNAATRGDGFIGEDVTRNAVYFHNVPTIINDKRHIVIRGEAVMLYSKFDQINSKLPDDKRYRNPRNMVVGAVKMLDSKRSSTYDIEFIPFDLVNAIDLGITKHSYGLIFIEQLGLKPVEWTFVEYSNIEDIVREKEEQIPNLTYPTDGLVVIYDDLMLNISLGSTRKYPRYAMAFKWADKLETTILTDIEWSVAETGLVTPIAVFNPVELEGTTVRRASLHNITIMRELGLGIGDHIRVYKANMIIPQVHDCIEKSNNISIPTTCPICGKQLEQRLGKNNKSLFLYCINSLCQSSTEVTRNNG